MLVAPSAFLCTPMPLQFVDGYRARKGNAALEAFFISAFRANATACEQCRRWCASVAWRDLDWLLGAMRAPTRPCCVFNECSQEGRGGPSDQLS